MTWVNLAQLPVDSTRAVLTGFDADSAPILDALDCLRVAITLYDSSERLIYLNQHYRYIFRSMPPQPALIGRTYDELIRLEIAGGEIDPAAYGDDIDAYVQRRRAQLTPGDFAPRDIPLATGRIIETKARRTSGGWIVLWSDATQTRRAHAQLETAVELSADAFAFWDKDDRLVMCNPGFAQLHGRGTKEGLTGVVFRDLMTAVAGRGLVKLEGSAEAWIEKRVDAHRAPAGALTMVTASGNAYLVRERATQDGGRATVYTDITDRHRAEAAFAEQSKTLRETRDALSEQANYLADLTQRLDHAERGASNAKTTFLRTMSHELKTPLNAIIGFSDLLKSAPDKISRKQVAEYAGLIHGAGGNLLRMLNQILDLTKIAAGRYPFSPIRIGVRGLIEGVCDGVSANAEDKSITLAIADCPEALSVRGDANALAVMIGQLAENAVTFTQAGGTVHFAAARIGDRVRITVEDNGPGVAAENLARIVEPFEQVGSGTATHSGGGGLGLPLAKALAELQGGTLALESAPGQGLTATLDLPAG